MIDMKALLGAHTEKWNQLMHTTWTDKQFEWPVLIAHQNTIRMSICFSWILWT